MSELRTIPLTAIAVHEGHNPRGTVNTDGLQPLADSIGRHGVLQPVIVSPGRDGGFVLVAGERRYLAAELAGLTEIPAVVRDLNGDGFAVAIVENLQREQLTPLEEARAFQHACNTGMQPAELAAAVGASEQLVRERLALLKLPESVQAKVDARELTLAAAKNLQTFATLGPAIVEKTAELITKEPEDRWDEPVTPRDLEIDPAFVLEQVIDELADEEKVLPFLARVNGRRALLAQTLAWPDTVDVAALERKVKLLPEYQTNPYARPRYDAQELTDEDLDAARAFGCVLLLPSRHDDEGVWITDPAWLADRLAQKLDAAIEALNKKVQRQEDAGERDRLTEKTAREKARKERQREQGKQLEARDRNLRLGRELEKKLRAPTPSVDGMRAIAEVLLAYAGDDLGRTGFRFTNEASQTETRRKDGSLSRVAHLRTTTDCRNLVEQFLDRAETAEEIYGALVQLIVATQYADVNAAPSSDRFGELRGVRYSGRAKGLTAAIDNIAKAVLSDELRKKAKRRR